MPHFHCSRIFLNGVIININAEVSHVQIDEFLTVAQCV